jgi:xylose dehydrogenase (NAD/NADP)
MLSTAAISEELLPAFRESQLNQLVAVASRDADRARECAERAGIERAYGSYEALLDDDSIAAVYIPLPNSLHGEWTRAALDHGKHVLCEKPLTPTAAEAETLFEHARSLRLVLAEAFMYRHHPKTQRVLELVAEGAIGTPSSIRSFFTFRAADPAADIRYRPELAGGALYDVGCYCVSFSMAVAGCEPTSVLGVAQRSGSGIDERFYGTLAFPNAVVAQFDCALDIPLSVGATILGTDGAIEVPMPWYAHLEPLSVYLRREGRATEIPTPGPNAYMLEIDDFAEAIATGRSPRVTSAETVRNLRVIEALRQSAGLPDVELALR